MTRLLRTLTVALALALPGCMSWTPGWEIRTSPAPGTSVDIADALGRLDDAGSAEELKDAIDALQGLVAAEPDNARAVAGLAEAQVLYGAAYATGRREKEDWYRAGIQSAERAMATNAEFRRRVEAGAPLDEAVEVLGADEMRPMLFWVIGVSYTFRDCLTGPGRAVSFRWMLRTRSVLERMLALDPGFERGAVLFSLGIYHIAAPPGVGRDLELAADYFDRAIEAGPTSLLVRWGRAKYFHVKTGDREAFREDLDWVIAQDPRNASSVYAWNVYFQRDAAAMLRQESELFD